MNNDVCVAAKREPMSSEILKMAAEISDRSARLSSRVKEKLMPVCREEPRPGNGEKELSKQYPPYYGELHNYLRGIRDSLNSIEETMSVCEV